MLDGTLNATVECNPLLFGHAAFDTVDGILAGKPVPKSIVITERLFDQSEAEAELPNRKY